MTRRPQLPIAATALLAVIATITVGRDADAASLSGSRYSLARQNAQARAHDFTYIRTRSQVSYFVSKGLLVPVRPNADFDLHAVSFPYARPAVKTFVHRLARQYRATCGEPMVVTSLTRPLNHQPRNASPDSVHPTGMAVDLRRSWSRKCRNWLEAVLLSLEDRGVLEANRERWPPHYHVAVYPEPYERYVEQLARRPAQSTHLVSRGDTLWRIARKHSTTVAAVKAANGLSNNHIYPGQVLRLPSGR